MGQLFLLCPSDSLSREQAVGTGSGPTQPVYAPQALLKTAESGFIHEKLMAVQTESDVQPVVIDANGFEVGTVASLQSKTPSVIFDLEEFPPFVVSVHSNNIRGSTGGNLFFESSDSTGVPPMSPMGGAILADVWIQRSLNDYAIHLADKEAVV